MLDWTRGVVVVVVGCASVLGVVEDGAGAPAVGDGRGADTRFGVCDADLVGAPVVAVDGRFGVDAVFARVVRLFVEVAASTV
jgi:hypothetical protein